MRILGDRYHLDEVLGVGGMAVVWRARDEVLGRDVAVKVLSGRHATDPASRHRIRIEARAAAAVAHPNIAQVHDFGETAEDGQRIPYIVMELVPGPTLEDRAAGGALPAAEALRICAEVAAGLAAAHADGLVHRDVKPANVILGPTGAKVVDFGIAAAADPAAAASPDENVLGTPAYLAPERITDDAVTPASDVYSLGVLVYRLLTGRLPWAVTDAAEVIEAHLRTAPAPLPNLDGVPPQVARLCLRCLAKEPAERPSAHEVAAALTAATAPDRSVQKRRRPTRLVAVGLAAATAAAALAWLLVPAPHRPPPAEAGLGTDTRAPAPPAPGSAAPPGSSAATTPAGRAQSTVRVSAPTAAGANGTAPAPGAVPTTAGGTTPPPPSPTPAQPGQVMTFTSTGGTIRAGCTAGGLAELEAWAPIAPYRVDRVDAGPAAAVVAAFTRGNQTIDMTVTCHDATPTETTTTHTA